MTRVARKGRAHVEVLCVVLIRLPAKKKHAVLSLCTTFSLVVYSRYKISAKAKIVLYVQHVQIICKKKETKIFYIISYVRASCLYDDDVSAQKKRQNFPRIM